MHSEHRDAFPDPRPSTPTKSMAFLRPQPSSGSAAMTGSRDQSKQSQRSPECFGGTVVLGVPTLSVSWAEGEWRIMPSQLRVRHSTESQGLKFTGLNSLSFEHKSI